MGIITSSLRQVAVYWANPVSDGRGNDTFDAPIEIKVRWQDGAVKFTDPLGNELVSTSLVFFDRDIQPGEYVKLGPITGSENANPKKEDGAYQIRQRDIIPNLKNTETLRKGFL